MKYLHGTQISIRKWAHYIAYLLNDQQIHVVYSYTCLGANDMMDGWMIDDDEDWNKFKIINVHKKSLI